MMMIMMMTSLGEKLVTFSIHHDYDVGDDAIINNG